MTVSELQYLHVRNAAKQVIPEDCVDIAPERIVVAILFSDADLSKPLDKSDFLWVKSKPKNSIAKFQTAYKGKRDHEPTPRFVVGAKVIEKSARASDLDLYHDNMVVLMVDNEPTTNGSSSGAAAPTAAPAPAGHAMNVSATPANDSRVDPARSGSHPVQARPALSVGTSPASSQSSLATSARPSPSVPNQNAMFTGTGGLGRHPQLPTGSPISWLSRTPTPTQTSPSSMATPQSPLTAAPPAQPVAQHAQTYSPYRQPPTQKSPHTAAPPVQPVAQHASMQSPYTQLPTPQPASGFPSTPEIAHKFPALIYGSTLGGPTSKPSGGRHPGDPPVKSHQQFAPMPNHAHQLGLNTHHTPAHAPAAQTVKAEARTQNQSLEILMSENELECLEAGVKQALKLLEKIEQPLQACQQQDQDAQEWLKSIHDLKSQNVKNRTILGVVGNTGAGKSSVINAMLDEERLVPTNCMRACTAVVTELSWNESNDDYSRYRAEIEFVKLEDWLKELQVLYSDLLDGSGKVSKECTNSEHEAGVAWAKIKAVYPQKTKEMIAEASPESLAREVQGLLGTTKRINESNPGDFYKRLQYFVDSQEKQKDSKEKKRMEYWPLIKVVKIYTKADALSTGAVVVDLPGVQDSNAARAAVAEGYMKQCSGLWIVAPITRAVDDKAAKKLLGDTFKRQLKLDGTYNNVTFICSKTDDISLVEAVSGLNLDETVSGMWSELDDLRSKVRKLQNEIEECKDSKQVYAEAVEDCDEKIDVWDNLLEDCADGKIVYAPTENSGKKRKRSKSPKKQPRKKRRAEDSDDDFIVDDEESEAEADSDATQSEPEDEVPDDREPLREQQIQDKIQELKNMKKEAKAERASIDEKMKDIRKDIKTLREKEASIDDHISRLCINGRNDYSRGAIAQDFAAGIRELDQETAEEENEDEFDPEVDLRDYDEVARSLPVFCVSSRAYQKLCGRLKRDKAVPGFKDVSETEVPKLQAHCKQLTEAGRIACARRFLNNLNQFLTSMSLWATNDGPSSLISADQRRQEQTFLKQKLEELGKGIQKVVHENLHGMAATLTEHVYANYNKLVQKACETALPTASGWGAHRSMGGLYWSTYKATVRRNGVYNGASGARDFNAELTAPILKEIATGWERAFQRRLPSDVRNFKANALKVLHSFHKAVVQRARRVGVSMARLNQLENQLRNHDGFLNGLVSAIVELVNTRQKEVNREFVPVIAAAMEHAYQVATDERGQGSYARMKAYVTGHVSQNQEQMFRDACEQVRDELNRMCAEVQRQLAEQTTQIYQTAYRDYNSAVGNLGAAEVEMSPTEKQLRADVEAIVKTAEGVFERVLKGEEDPDEMAAQDEDAGAEEDEGADAVKDEGAGAQGDNDQDDEHSTVKQENVETHEAQAAEQHPLGRTLAEELLAAQNEDKENAVDADTAGKATWKPPPDAAAAARAADGPSVLGDIGGQALNRFAHGDAHFAHLN